MKKVLIIILILISIILLNRNNDISNDIIRFRVIANSNSSKENVVVAIIDSGFDLGHSFMQQQNLASRIDERYMNGEL